MQQMSTAVLDWKLSNALELQRSVLNSCPTLGMLIITLNQTGLLGLRHDQMCYKGGVFCHPKPISHQVLELECMFQHWWRKPHPNISKYCRKVIFNDKLASNIFPLSLPLFKKTPTQQENICQPQKKPTKWQQIWYWNDCFACHTLPLLNICDLEKPVHCDTEIHILASLT